MPATGSGEGGTTFLLDLPQATALRDGDGLVLDDSSIVRVVGRHGRSSRTRSSPTGCGALAC